MQDFAKAKNNAVDQMFKMHQKATKPNRTPPQKNAPKPQKQDKTALYKS